jgi:hypothetical protein
MKQGVYEQSSPTLLSLKLRVFFANEVIASLTKGLNKLRLFRLALPWGLKPGSPPSKMGGNLLRCPMKKTQVRRPWRSLGT